MAYKTKTDKQKIRYKLKRDDEVVVIAGRDYISGAITGQKDKKGRTKRVTGKIESIDLKRGKLRIPGVNMVKKHRKKTQENKPGEVVEIPSLIDISNVMILCPKCNRGVRVRIKRENGKKQRLCHKCGHLFDKK